jgi:hypothetical protein
VPAAQEPQPDDLDERTGEEPGVTSEEPAVHDGAGGQVLLFEPQRRVAAAELAAAEREHARRTVTELIDAVDRAMSLTESERASLEDSYCTESQALIAARAEPKQMFADMTEDIQVMREWRAS